MRFWEGKNPKICQKWLILTIFLGGGGGGGKWRGRASDGGWGAFAHHAPLMPPMLIGTLTLQSQYAYLRYVFDIQIIMQIKVRINTDQNKMDRFSQKIQVSGMGVDPGGGGDTSSHVRQIWPIFVIFSRFLAFFNPLMLTQDLPHCQWQSNCFRYFDIVYPISLNWMSQYHRVVIHGYVI